MKITLTMPKGKAIPYILPAQEYLQAGTGANVRQYKVEVDNPNQPIVVKWTCDGSGVHLYKLTYATNADYTDAIVVDCAGNFVELYNLYKDMQYYVKVTAQNEQGATLAVAEDTFTTTDIGPRVMLIPDIHNVRDVGGYQTADGKTTRQGLVYRGGTLRPADVYKSNLTDEGAKYMSEILRIKTEIDFRGTKEAGYLTDSVIPGATLVYARINGYHEAFLEPQGYKKTFEILAEKENYPVYYHCTGGADRTGTVTFLLNGLLGVSETECIQDYEFTTFSHYNERNSQEGEYSIYFKDFRGRLENCAGETLQEKIESYLLSIGITKSQIDNIKAIMYGEN